MRRRLAYTISPHNGSVVFATPERARLVDQINRAIGDSTTWGEFRKAMPSAEYSDIVRGFDDCGELRPKGSDPFDASQLPGFDEGGYPPWLQAEMASILPVSFLHRFAVAESGFTSGSFWTIPQENLAPALVALKESGYVVDKGGNLRFW